MLKLCNALGFLLFQAFQVKFSLFFSSFNQFGICVISSCWVFDSIGIFDFSRISVSENSEEVISPIDQFDSFNGNFYNLKTALSQTNNNQKFLDEKDKVEKILRESMETAVKLSVPLTVGVASGKSWYEA